MNNKEKIASIVSLIYIFLLVAILTMLSLVLILHASGAAIFVVIFLVVFIVGYVIVGLLRNNAYSYKCPKCGNIQNMNFFQYVFSKRNLNSRKLTCKKCGIKDYLERIPRC